MSWDSFAVDEIGEEIYDLLREIYPIPRSISGDGVRQTFDVLSELLPLDVTEVPTGTAVFDWTVPQEWNIRDAWIADSDGRRVVDFRNCNLHVLGYSVPIRTRLTLAELRASIFTPPDGADGFRQDLTRERWGFCVGRRQLEAMPEGSTSLPRIKHGLVASCVGDPGPLTYKRSRRGNAEIDRAVANALRDQGEATRLRDFVPLGGDERQFCSPGIDLPVGALSRTPADEFPEYHSSADNLEFVRPEALGDSFVAYMRVFDRLERNGRFLNLNPKGEPQLGKRGLYRSIGRRIEPRGRDALGAQSLRQKQRPARDLGSVRPSVPGRARSGRRARRRRSSPPAVRVALVTGGGRGVGRVMAEALASEGYAVSVAARTARELDATVETIAAQGGTAVGISGDLTERETVERVVAETEERLGPVDVLVNNAGRAHAIGPIWEVDPADWWQDVEVSVRAAFLCCRAMLPSMLARDSGRVLNVSSYVALRPTPYISGYAAAKAAVLSLTEALAASVAETSIRVFAITPGLFRSELMRHLMESEAERRWLPSIGQSGWVEPERVARLVGFLASGEGDAFHGRFLHALDDLDELVRRADEIARDDLFTPRLRR